MHTRFTVIALAALGLFLTAGCTKPATEDAAPASESAASGAAPEGAEGVEPVTEEPTGDAAEPAQ
jgi:hypothetical protein